MTATQMEARDKNCIAAPKSQTKNAIKTNKSRLKLQQIHNELHPFDRLDASERMRQLGSICWLMLQSDLHHRYAMGDLVERIMPSLLCDQYRYYELNGEPVGFCNWARLTDEVEAKVCTGEYVLEPKEWVSGQNLWFMEFIAPFDNSSLIVNDLRRNVFPQGTAAKALRIDPQTGELRGIARYIL